MVDFISSGIKKVRLLLCELMCQHFPSLFDLKISLYFNNNIKNIFSGCVTWCFTMYYFFMCRIRLQVLLSFQVLLEFLQRIIDYRDKNKMTLNNIAMVMAPNLFTFHGFGSKSIEQNEFVMAAGTANVMRFMIKYQKLLWTVSMFLRYIFPFCLSLTKSHSRCQCFQRAKKCLHCFPWSMGEWAVARGLKHTLSVESN